MTLLYLIGFIVMSALLINFRFNKGKKVDFEIIQYRLRTSKWSLVSIVINVLFSMILTGFVIYITVYYKPDRSLLGIFVLYGFYLGALLTRSYLQVKEYGVTDESIVAITYTNRVVKTWMLDDIYTIEYSNNTLKLKLCIKTILSTLKIRIDKNDEEVISFLSGKIITEKDKNLDSVD